MSAPPYMKLYWGDYLKATRHLSRDQHGAYLLLIGEAWRLGGTLPDDDALLGAWALCTGAEWLAMKPTIMAFFAFRRGKWVHDRVREELAHYDDVSRKRKTAGRKGGSASVGKVDENYEANASQKPTKPEPEPEPKEITPLSPTGESGLFELEPEEPAAPTDEVQQAFDLWNVTAMACGLPRAKTLDEGRRRAIRKRLDVGGLDVWRDALKAVEVSAFLCGLRPGSDGRAFKADLTFVCQAKSFQRLVDGGYGDDAPAPQRGPAPAAVDPWRKRVSEFVANGHWSRLDWGPPPGKPGCTVAPEILTEFNLSERSAA